MAFATNDPASSELITPRVELRPAQRGDLDGLHAAILETLPELIRWLPWARAGHSRLDTRRYLRGSRTAWSQRHTFEFVLEDRDGGSLLGVVSLHRIDWLRRCAGLGYWIRHSRQRQGLATETVGALIDHAFGTLRLHRLEAHIAPENTASQGVARALGFVREGIAREAEFVDGQHLDHIQFSVLRSDPRRRVGERA
jgi:RimJ/RimL family protein N-acetyltransferase